MAQTDAPTTPAATPELDPEVNDVLGRLRACYASLLSQLEIRSGTAVEVERSMGLNKKLAWQVHRIASSSTPLGAAPRVPGPAATREILRAAKALDAPAEELERIKSLTQEFQETVRRHADDRSTFDLMVSAVTGEGLEARDHDLRRAAYRANRQLHGKYCATDLFTLLVVPGQVPGTVDLCSIRGLVGLRRLRPAVRLEVARHRFDLSDGTIQRRERLDDRNDDGESIELLREFGSEPLPPIHAVESADGFVRSYAETAHLGLQSSTTCFLADVVRNSPVSDELTPDAGAVGHIHEIATPSALLIQDCLIHESLCDGMTPEVRVLPSRRDAEVWPGNDPTMLFPIQETIEEPGTGPESASVPEVPRYAEMISHVTSRLGWEAERLRLYRVRASFPVLHSVVWMRFAFSG